MRAFKARVKAWEGCMCCCRRRLLLVVLSLSIAACAVPRPAVKIALVAPFEGRLRRVGYDVFPAFRLAIRQHAQQPTPVAVTFIAFDDRGDPEMAARVAEQVVRDPEVVGVIGHFALSTTLAALPVYARANMPLLAPHVPADALPPHPLLFRMGPARDAPRHVDATPCAEVAPALPLDAAFGVCVGDAPAPNGFPEAEQALAGFASISLGPPPTARSIVGYEAAQVMLLAIDAAAQYSAPPTRAGVAEALRRVRRDGLLGTITFDAEGRWREAPLWRFAR